MCYEERSNAGEMHSVLVALEECLVKGFGRTGVSNHGTAHDALLEWSRAMRAEFQRSNLHFTSLETHSREDQIINAVQVPCTGPQLNHPTMLSFNCVIAQLCHRPIMSLAN